ncbi:MAG: FAD-binding protein, partial [Clostridiales bacterium]
MNKAQWFQALQEIFSNKVLTDEPMRRHTTWKIGGPADFMVFPASEAELQQCLALLEQENMSRFIIGNGSNLLVGDKGIRGVVVKMGEPFSESYWRDNQVEACAGMLLSALALETADRSLAGLEFSRGIPGSVGGAIRMNAGAYGNTIGEYVTEVEALTFGGEKKLLKKEQITFAYRDSSLYQFDGIITRVRFQLHPGDREQILAKIKEFSQKRS